MLQLVSIVFFSSRRRHTRCALVTGVQTCALPISGLPADAVQLVPVTDRAAVGAMLKAAGLIDIIIPRGGKSLVARVQEEARVPEIGRASCRERVCQYV